MRARVMIVPMGTAMRVLRLSGLECDAVGGLG